jgi:hypothetical protein
MPINHKLIDDFLAANVIRGLKHHSANESNKVDLEIVNAMYEYIKNFTNATFKDFPDELLNEWQSSLDLGNQTVDRN